MPIRWEENNCFTVGDTRFRAVDLGLGEFESTTQLFVLQKPRAMLARYERLIAETSPENIVELGIWCGGSCVLLQKLTGGKVVAIDRDDRARDVLAAYCREQALTERLKPVFGVDQADRASLERLVDREFAGHFLDLVADDASHFLEESRIAFNTLFPRLRPGGKYVIEDWSWAHGPLHLDDATPGFYPDRKPLTTLVFECILACASAPGVVAAVDVDHHLVIVTRGETALDRQTFDISRCCLARGRALINTGS